MTNKKQGITLDYPSTPTTKAKYDAFVREFHINGNNGTQAAIHAGYSKKTAGRKANQLLKIVYIQDELQRLKDEAVEEYTISVEKRLRWAEQVIEKGLRDQLDAIGNNKAENLQAVNGALGVMNQMLGDAEDKKEPEKIAKVEIQVVSANS